MSKEKKSYMVHHVDKPSEPWGTPGEWGRVTRVAPGAHGIPSTAYIEWGEKHGKYHTWERCNDLRLWGELSWDQVLRGTRESRNTL